MQATNPEISVVICSYNRANYIREALQSLYNQTLPHTQFEVIVVDNASTDNTESVCKDFITEHSDAAFYYMLESRQGASFARNTGAAKVKAPLLCFMDDDAIAYPDFLTNLLAFFREVPAAGGCNHRH